MKSPIAGADFELERFRAGDQEHFRHLVREVSPRLLRVIRGFARDGDHADDLLQATWIRIYRKRALFSGTGSFLGWALTVCRNVCRMDVRKRRMDGGKGRMDRGKGLGARLLRLDDQRDLADPMPGPAELSVRQQRAVALYAALEGLARRERDAILMRLIEGRSAAEVGCILGVKEVSVRSLIHRGLAKLSRMEELARKIL